MITYEKALGLILEDIPQRESLSVPLSECVGAVCAEEIRAPLNIQPFDNSAMDGFAVKFSDLLSASQSSPITLDISGRIAAGPSKESLTLEHGKCIEIMTGSPIPLGCDAVIPKESSSIEGSKASFIRPVRMGENLRYAGEDFRIGDKVIAPGTRLDSCHLLVLATLGISHVQVRAKPKIGFVSTGNELVDGFWPNRKLISGEIYNSTSAYLEHEIKSLGAHCHSYGTIADDPDAFIKILEKMCEDDCEIMISTGAVSVGRHDFVKEALERLGAQVLYCKLSIRPGKPSLFARLPGNRLFFGLPGNPVSTICGLRFLIYPLIRALAGREPEKPISAIASNSFTKQQALRFFLKAKLVLSEDQRLHVHILDGQQSFMVSPFLQANAWAVIPENINKIRKGDCIDCFRLDPNGLSL